MTKKKKKVIKKHKPSNKGDTTISGQNQESEYNRKKPLVPDTYSGTVATDPDTDIP